MPKPVSVFLSFRHISVLILLGKGSGAEGKQTISISSQLMPAHVNWLKTSKTLWSCMHQRLQLRQQLVHFLIQFAHLSPSSFIQNASPAAWRLACMQKKNKKKRKHEKKRQRAPTNEKGEHTQRLLSTSALCGLFLISRHEKAGTFLQGHGGKSWEEGIFCFHK